MLSVWLGELLVRVMPGDQLSRAISTAPDIRVAGFTALLSLVTAILFGIAPALRGPKLELNRTLREEAGTVAGAAHHGRFRKGLVVAQVALSMLLVAGAGLFARSLYNLKHLNPGFDTNNLISFTVDPSLAGYDQGRIKRFYDTLLARLREQPGVLFGIGRADWRPHGQRLATDHPRAWLRAEARREHEPEHERGRARLLSYRWACRLSPDERSRTATRPDHEWPSSTRRSPKTSSVTTTRSAADSTSGRARIHWRSRSSAW